MKLLQLSLKEIIIINIILSLCIGALGGSYLYTNWQNHQYLMAKLHHLTLTQKVVQKNSSDVLINTTQLLQYLKAETSLQLKLITSTQEADGLHLKFSGSLEGLTRLVAVLATSTLKEASLEQGKEGYALSLNLTNLRLQILPTIKAKPKPTVEKIIGSVTLNQHHYCVIKKAGQKSQLKEQPQC